ncbi:LysR family transcriptional regulator [Vibrio toranzoniae]|uniref:LysR family transcriptional regulator n=1 Tax=Vibrio toranzoniae TaxID=1194427 RepID=UPI001377BB03|nr:LysR substrate-binding domain-containing protein [Vibrio toranzoniae]NAZ96043.1 LysR family transcriptional regulator [Vibrio toranzoniae]
MNIRWLKDFITLADCQKFSVAAKLNTSSQAAFSRRIQQLEQHLKVELFDRSRTPIKMTIEGKRLYPIACELVHISERCEEMIATKNNPIVIASLHTLACNFFPEWYTHIINNVASPLLTSIDSGVRSVSGYQAALQSQRVDCLLFYQNEFVANYFESDDFHVLKLADDELIWVCGKNFPLVQLTQNDIPHLTYAPSSQLLELSAPLLALTPQAQKLSTYFQSTISESLLPMAMHGHGVACIPRTVAQPYINDGRLVHIWRDYQVPLDITLIRLQHARNSHPFLDDLFETARQLSFQTKDQSRNGKRSPG